MQVLVNKIDASYIIRKVGNVRLLLHCKKKFRKQLKNVKKFNLLTANKVRGGFITNYIPSVHYRFSPLKNLAQR